MQETQLPTYAENERHVLTHLDRARAEMSEVRGWLLSDWRPLGSPRPDGATEAADKAMTAVGAIKILIDEAKSELDRR